MNRFIFIAVLALTLALAYSCDRRGGPITGIVPPNGTASLKVEIVPEATLFLPDLTMRLGCFVTDGSGAQVGGVTVHFRALLAPNMDSLYITENKVSSGTDTLDGLSGNLYFDLKGNVGEILLTAFIYSNDTSEVVADADTATVLSLPYSVEIASMQDTIEQGQSAYITCKVWNPLDSSRVNRKHLLFHTLEAGMVDPAEATVDTTKSNGMNVNVAYTAPLNLTGDFRTAGHVIWDSGVSGYKVIGSDTLTITVIEN